MDLQDSSRFIKIHQHTSCLVSKYQDSSIMIDARNRHVSSRIIYEPWNSLQGVMICRGTAWSGHTNHVRRGFASTSAVNKFAWLKVPKEGHIALIWDVCCSNASMPDLCTPNPSQSPAITYCLPVKVLGWMNCQRLRQPLRPSKTRSFLGSGKK